MSDEPFATGRCLCGAVRFKIKSAPLAMAQCHCRDCQRSSGTGHMSNARFKAEDVEIVGETASYTVKTDSGNEMARHFCPTCGSRMFLKNKARPGAITFAAGVFDDLSWFKPQVVLYTKSRPAWDNTSGDIPNFEAMPPPKPPQSR